MEPAVTQKPVEVMNIPVSTPSVDCALRTARPGEGIFIRTDRLVSHLSGRVSLLNRRFTSESKFTLLHM